MKALVLTVLAGIFLGISCSSDKPPKERNFEETAASRSSTSAQDFIVRDFGTRFGVFDVRSGNYFYCQDCYNNLNIDQDISFTGSVAVGRDMESIYFLDQNRSPLFSVVLDRSIGTVSSNTTWNTVPSYAVNSIGYSEISKYDSKGQLVTKNISNWIPDNYDDFTEGLPLCRCVSESSIPCNASGNNHLQGSCDVGGDSSGATGCGTGKGSGIKAIVMGNSFGGTQNNTCSVSCGDAYYACCIYTDENTQSR